MKNKSNSEQLRDLFKTFNKKYLDDILANQEEPEAHLISEAPEIVKDENFDKPISEVFYQFSEN